MTTSAVGASDAERASYAESVLRILAADGPSERVPEAVRKAGVPPQNASTYVRWCTRGVRGVRLEAVRMGGVWYTTTAAVVRFIARQQPTAEQLSIDRVADRERRRADARTALAARGLKSGSISRGGSRRR